MRETKDKELRRVAIYFYEERLIGFSPPMGGKTPKEWGEERKGETKTQEDGERKKVKKKKAGGVVLFS